MEVIISSGMVVVNKDIIGQNIRVKIFRERRRIIKKRVSMGKDFKLKNNSNYQR